MISFVRQTFQAALIWCPVQLLLFAYLGYGPWVQKPECNPPIKPTAPALIELEQIGELATMRVQVADILIGEGEGYRGFWLIHGDALLSCDLANARIEEVDEQARTATIRLPKLRVMSARIDHDKSRIWSIEKTTWLPWKWGDHSAVCDAAMFHGQELVQTAAASEGNLAQGRAQAEMLIFRIYDSVGWKVSIDWR